LDGDLILDLAFAQSGFPGQDQEVVIAFGASAGPPVINQTAAHVHGVTQIGVLPYDGPDDQGELFVLYDLENQQEGAGAAVAWFLGGGDRSLMCKVELTTFDSDGSIETIPALMATSGGFLDPNRRDALVFGSNLRGGRGMWLVPDLKSRQGRPERVDFAFDRRIAAIQAMEGSAAEITLLLTAADTDSDGLDNLIVAATDTDGTQCLVSTSRMVARDQGHALRSDDAVVLPEPCSGTGQLAAADLNGDSAREILLLSSPASGERTLYVLWNDGSGHFSADAVSSVAGSDESPNAFAALPAIGAAKPALAYVTRSGVHLLREGSHARELEDTRLPAEITDGTGIASADIDGDGIPDLVVADGGSLRVMRAELSP
jgi:hypothetical protein